MNMIPSGTTVSSKTGVRAVLVGPAKPGVLPGKGDDLEIAADPNDGAVAVAELEGLVSGDENSARGADPGVRLKRVGILHSIEASPSAIPVISIERNPPSEFQIIADMKFSPEHGGL